MCLAAIFILDTAFLFSKDKGVYLYDDGTVLIKNRCTYNFQHYDTHTRYKLEVRDILSVDLLNKKAHLVRITVKCLYQNMRIIFHLELN